MDKPESKIHTIVRPFRDSQSYIEVYDRLKSRAEEKKPQKFDPKQHKDQTRSTIAKIFTWAYFVLIGVALIGVPIYDLFVEGEKILSLKDTLLVISSVIGGPFGFVVGYYFKGTEEK